MMPNSLEIVQSDFIKKLFYILGHNDVWYVVLRGYETLPEKVCNDIDIYVSTVQWRKVCSILDILSQQYGITRIYSMSRLGFRQVTLFSSEHSLQLQLDFYLDINWKGFCYCLTEQIENSKKQYNGITVLTEGVEAAIVLLKEILHNGKVKSRRNGRERLLFCIKNERHLFEQALLPFFHDSFINCLAEHILAQQWSAIESKTNTIRRSVIINNFKNNPFNSTIKYFQWFHQIIVDKFSGKGGFFAAFIGPDGSGKTTLVNAVTSELNGTLFVKTNHLASNFEILPLLSSILRLFKGKGFGNRPRGVDNFQGLHSGMNQKVNTPLRSILYILWYSLDLILGRVIILRKKSQRELVFFARYFYDYYYQRGNKYVPHWFLDVIHIFIPKPDIVFYISRDAESIFKSKPELSVEEIKRQQLIIESLAKHHENFIMIDGDYGIGESKRQIIDAICKMLAARV